MNETNFKKLQSVYTKAIARLNELLKLEKAIIAKHKKAEEAKKIEVLRSKILK